MFPKLPTKNRWSLMIFSKLFYIAPMLQNIDLLYTMYHCFFDDFVKCIEITYFQGGGSKFQRYQVLQNRGSQLKRPISSVQ